MRSAGAGHTTGHDPSTHQPAAVASGSLALAEHRRRRRRRADRRRQPGACQVPARRVRRSQPERGAGGAGQSPAGHSPRACTSGSTSKSSWPARRAPRGHPGRPAARACDGRAASASPVAARPISGRTAARQEAWIGRSQRRRRDAIEPDVRSDGPPRCAHRAGARQAPSSSSGGLSLEQGRAPDQVAASTTLRLVLIDSGASRSGNQDCRRRTPGAPMGAGRTPPLHPARRFRRRAHERGHRSDRCWARTTGLA